MAAFQVAFRNYKNDVHDRFVANNNRMTAMENQITSLTSQLSNAVSVTDAADKAELLSMTKELITEQAELDGTDKTVVSPPVETQPIDTPPVDVPPSGEQPTDEQPVATP